MTKACEKRPVSLEQLEKVAEEIIQDLEANHPREVSTKLVGAKVMEKLHALDEVAYVRYASVYRQFQDIGEFISEIQSLARKIKDGTHQPELFKINGGGTA
jgi:transcriptional repressor NrdR